MSIRVKYAVYSLAMVLLAVALSGCAHGVE
jgi:hypothetical protein